MLVRMFADVIAFTFFSSKCYSSVAGRNKYKYSRQYFKEIEQTIFTLNTINKWGFLYDYQFLSAIAILEVVLTKWRSHTNAMCKCWCPYNFFTTR